MGCMEFTPILARTMVGRLSRAGEARVDALKGSEEQAFRKAKKRGRGGEVGRPVRRLDEFFRRA
ncbi:hypothetical protein WLZ34_01530 [Thermogladius sp. KZ2Tp1]|uniref:hypothetical protein n=1 Tax=Thermogladius sp. KZ2Tp1 TaxID=3136289 RepID=UPI003DA9108C